MIIIVKGVGRWLYIPDATFETRLAAQGQVLLEWGKALEEFVVRITRIESCRKGECCRLQIVLLHQIDYLIGAVCFQKVTIRVDGFKSEGLGQLTAFLKGQNMADGSAVGAVRVRGGIGYIQRAKPSATMTHQ